MDAATKDVLKYATTPANVHDSKKYKHLVGRIDNAAIGDSAYESEENERYTLEDCDCENFVMEKARRGKPLTDGQKTSNRRISRMRVRVEHVFGRLKQFGADAVRTMGQKWVHQHHGLSNLVYKMDRYAMLAR